MTQASQQGDQELAGKLQSALDAGGVGVWHWTLTQDAFTSRTVRPVSGPLQAETLPAWLEQVHPDDRQQFLADLDAAIRDGQRSFTLYRVGKPGAERIIRTRVAVVRRDGEPPVLVGADADVTELASVKAALQRALRRLSEAERVGQVGHWEFDLTAGQAFWSDGFFAILGLAPGEIAPAIEAFASFLHPDDAWAGAKIADAAQIAELDDVAYRIVRRDGEVRWVAGRSGFERDADGAVLRITGILRDVTALRREQAESAAALVRAQETEQALRATMDRLRMATEVARVGTWEWDMVADRTVADDVTHDIWMVERGEQLDAWVANIVPEDRPGFDAEVLDAVRTGRHRFSPIRLRKDGQERRITTSVAVTYDAERRPVRMIGADVDITAVARAEEALRQAQTMEAVAQLSGGVAHDFNNLLGIVLGAVELALTEPDEDAKRGHLMAAARAARRGADLTRRLKSLAVSEPGERIRTSASALAADLLPVLTRAVRDDVSFQIDMSPEAPDVLVDPGGFQNAVLNLILNAVDAMPDGGKLTFAVGAGGEGEAVIRVADSGRGMSADVLARAAEPFFTTKGGAGSGLGLSMVQRFVQSHGGRLTLDSAPGAGTRALIVLPPAPQTPAGADAPQPARAGEGRCVLVIDDERALAEIVAARLRRWGYRTAIAASAAEARDTARLQRPDAIVCDVMLPDAVNGYALADEILAAHPGLPVVFMSAHIGAALPAACGRRTLAKPVDFDALLRELGGAIAERERLVEPGGIEPPTS